MSDTPRTSRLIAAIEDGEGEPVDWRNAPEEWVNLARELERDLAVANRFLEGEKIARQYAIDKGVELQRINFNLRQALNDARAWGVHSMGYSAQQSGALARWIDTGMVGTPPPIPDYYPRSPFPNV